MFQDLPIVANYKHINLQEKPFRELGSVLCDDLYGWDGGGWEGGPRGRGYMYTYNRFTSLYRRN